MIHLEACLDKQQYARVENALQLPLNLLAKRQTLEAMTPSEKYTPNVYSTMTCLCTFSHSEGDIPTWTSKKCDIDKLEEDHWGVWVIQMKKGDLTLFPFKWWCCLAPPPHPCLFCKWCVELLWWTLFFKRFRNHSATTESRWASGGM